MLKDLKIFLFIIIYFLWSLLDLWNKIKRMKIWSNADTQNKKWIRPLSMVEELFEKAHQRGIMLTSYCLSIDAAHPLKKEIVIETLKHLQSKIPTLRFCIREKNDGKQLWFHQMDQNTIDFQVKHDADFESEFFGMTEHHYAVKNGPMWCVRLFPQPHDAPSAMPELNSQFPHKYKIIFGFHHAITDGSSTMRICGHFMDILNDVIGEKTVDDNVQLAYFANDEETMALTMKAGFSMVFRPWQYPKYRDLVLNSCNESLFLKAYPPPAGSFPKRTMSIEYDFGAVDTARFLKKCRSESVTIHSAFCTAINAAFVEMLVKRGIDQEKYKIANFHTINMRRYWKESSPEKGFGTQFGRLSFIQECDQNFKDNFWDHARQFNIDLKFRLKDWAPMKEVAALILSLPYNLKMDDLMKGTGQPKPYYSTTNMGNLNNIFPGNGEHVQITSLRRTTSSDASIFAHVMQTLRGRFLFSLDYQADKVTKDTAQLHLDTIFKILRSVL